MFVEGWSLDGVVVVVVVVVVVEKELVQHCCCLVSVGRLRLAVVVLHLLNWWRCWCHWQALVPLGCVGVSCSSCFVLPQIWHKELSCSSNLGFVFLIHDRHTEKNGSPLSFGNRSTFRNGTLVAFTPASSASWLIWFSLVWLGKHTIVSKAAGILERSLVFSVVSVLDKRSLCLMARLY